MKKVAVFVVIILMAFTLTVDVYADCGSCGVGAKKSVCSNPTGDTIDRTPSIKAMQSQSARGLGHTTDSLGNKVSTQTDNSGQNQLGR
ncbi:MAG: hypothetical protein NTZ95_07705 [Candidatus Omnitrophica bacterium]|nr:hypothetical protein [Candidatus Omnitrophota bacterium]